MPKFDFQHLADIMRAWNQGKDMSEMPWSQGTPFSLSGGQPRTWTPGPQPFVPYMPQAQQSGPVTFAPAMITPPKPGDLPGTIANRAFPGGMPPLRKGLGQRPFADGTLPTMNLGMGKLRK